MWEHCPPLLLLMLNWVKAKGTPQKNTSLSRAAAGMAAALATCRESGGNICSSLILLVVFPERIKKLQYACLYDYAHTHAHTYDSKHDLEVELWFRDQFCPRLFENNSILIFQTIVFLPSLFFILLSFLYVFYCFCFAFLTIHTSCHMSTIVFTVGQGHIRSSKQ